MPKLPVMPFWSVKVSSSPVTGVVMVMVAPVRFAQSTSVTVRPGVTSTVRVLLGVGRGPLASVIEGGSLTAATVMVRVWGTEVLAPSVARKVTVRLAVEGVSLGSVPHRAQHRLVLRHRGSAGQREGAGAAVEAADDPAAGGQGEYVLGVGVVDGDLDGGPGQVGRVGGGDGQRRADHRGCGVLVVGEAAGIERHDRRGGCRRAGDGHGDGGEAAAVRGS